MATTVITNYSTELNQGPPGQPNVYLPLRANQFLGKVRVSTFTYTAANDQNINNAMCIIPSGARILGLKWTPSASLGSATVSFGLAGKSGTIGQIDDGTGADTAALGTTVADDTAFFGALATNTTANVFVEAVTGASKAWMYQTAKQVYVTFSVSNTAALTTQVIKGYVIYIVE